MLSGVQKNHLDVFLAKISSMKILTFLVNLDRFMVVEVSGRRSRPHSTLLEMLLAPLPLYECSARKPG